MANITHGMTKTRIYQCWRGMKSRCYYKRNIAYDRYGGRGIQVCDEWRNDFMAFREWSLSNGYSDELTLDRINTNGNYEPSNCRWATMKEQNRNRRDNVLMEYEGQVKTESEWAEIVGVDKSTMSDRLKKWSIADAVTKAPRGIYLEFNGETKTLKQWAEVTGIPYATLKTRHRKGWTPEQILSKDRYIEFNGESKTIVEWSEVLNIPKATLYKRLDYGWTVERAFTQKVRPRGTSPK